MLINSAFLFLLGFTVPIAGKCCRTVAETDLVMVFLVHRHGDRSSEKVQLFLSDNPEELARMSQPYGFGQLTDSGKAQSFALGQYLRHRYNALLSPSYSPSEIFVRSTESDRTQMTARIALTGVYSSEVMWSEDMEVVPVEIDVVLAKVDPNLSFMNCPKLTSYFLGFQAENKNKEKQNYEEVLDVLFEEMGLNLPRSPLLMYAMADCFASQESVGMSFTGLQQKLGPSVRQGAKQAINYMFANPECQSSLRPSCTEQAGKKKLRRRLR